VNCLFIVSRRDRPENKPDDNTYPDDKQDPGKHSHNLPAVSFAFAMILALIDEVGLFDPTK
jgi:hypothetical protein